ncbi:DUF3263 domain-containing protein [Mycobacteroides abscessus]|uniref:DUF3263 domain-containing protein n=1 Tax=Mycobacteroides abscessus TaxID=36809 RepID=UPI00092CBA06|nr:DUF3263 domain-containing protein [Mycobacteroides abscessus]SIE26359.1 Fis family transcriptional regulator [Mycobacteroides abscessus subsp. abscessus]SKV85727.1 Fis family transcriptional regulator [Mycobacteroides abscessus subsp. abscessus]SKW23557.1 Fis family transcriptional regulator [Mycobacteroides abscessus subsp. abscessus]
MNVTEVIEFERIWWHNSESKEQAIRGKFNISPTRYYQRLNDVLDSPEAIAIDAVTANRLRRIHARA